MVSYIEQMVFSALALAQSEVIWFFQHVGIASSKSKAARMAPVEIVSQVFLLFIG
jgi:NCK-associated protein 1